MPPGIKTSRFAGSFAGQLTIALLFIVGVGFFAWFRYSGSASVTLLVFAAVIGAYMAMNIGANDVANNVGPAVGSFALTLGWAIVIAAVFEAGGAIIAGGDVVTTVKNGIIDPNDLPDPQMFVWVMMAALLGAAIWLNITTWSGAPVSTTHAIVGGVAGAGIAAAGWSIVNWGSLGNIVLSWFVSPLAGGLIAAGLLYFLNKTIFWRPDPAAAAVVIVPWVLGVVAWTFSTYLLLKGLNNVIEVHPLVATAIGFGVGAITVAITRPRLRRNREHLAERADGINSLFTIPLIFGAALLSFAHGANDVANAVGPLAGIVEVLSEGIAESSTTIPLWVLAVGAFGIAIGLALFGPRLIRTVGSEITDLDRSRAFCIAVSAALTVIVASQMGLPVSSTHVAIGAIFGIGFLREFLQGRMNSTIENVLAKHKGDTHMDEVREVLEEFQHANAEEKAHILDELKHMGKDAVITAAQQRKLKKALKRQLVKRSQITKIVSAWVITVPMAAGLSALFYYMLRGMLMP